MNITELLIAAIQQKASDVHLSVGIPPFIRVNGNLQQLNDNYFSQTQLKELIFSLLTDQQKKIVEKGNEYDFSFSMSEVSRFRVNVYYEQCGIAAAFRVIPVEVPSLDEITSASIFKKLTRKPSGLVLLTGATGSGKSTTLAAMIDYINTHFPQHIITIEDPIEFIHSNKKSVIHQREIHRDTKSFNHGLRAALRADPDIILIGEMRDLESIRLALTAAETGHLVFSTLHTISAAQTINRIIDVFPKEEKSLIRTLLSQTLEAVISQNLVERVGGGRVAVHEIMICTAAIRNLIKEDKVAQIRSMIETGMQYGMQTMEWHLQKLIEEGCVREFTGRILSS